MFSGKSTEMVKQIRSIRLLEETYICINHRCDDRYGVDKIVTHDRISEDAYCITELLPVLTTTVFLDAKFIFIEEGHFFKDLAGFVIESVNKYSKHVVVSGLDGDYKQEPFVNITRLLPFADDVIKLKALCLLCKDGTSAPFSKRIVKNTDEFLVGGTEAYVSVCRKHLV